MARRPFHRETTLDPMTILTGPPGAATNKPPQVGRCSYNQNMPTWDEPKRLRNIKNHGLDFVACEAVFDGPVVTWEDARGAYGEQRINLLGWLDGVVVHMTYTERGDEPHIISLRKAAKHEIRRYAKETTGYSR